MEQFNSHPRRRRSKLLLITLFLSQTIFAQQHTVTGTIKSNDGSPLAGVSILVKNTIQGTISDNDGKYSIIAGVDAFLVFSFIGYITQEVPVNERQEINLILDQDVIQPGEVFITALGISRRTEAIQSAITKVSGVGISQMHENNLGSALQGRVAGLNISRSKTGPAGSSRVIIRGNKSTMGLNQPLYVVDGIPVDNTIFEQIVSFGGTDQGDGLTSINPEDIESVTVLKGASAAALYGSMGGNGVINIVTRKGSGHKGIGIDFSSEFVFEKVHNLSDPQKVYGPGGMAIENPEDPSSPVVYSKAKTQQEAFNWGTMNMWGPMLDGTPVIQFDGVERPYSYAGDNWERYYQTGHSLTNNIAISGGGEKQTFRFSFSDLRSTFIIPNSGFNRKNVSISTNGKFGKRITFNAKVMYSNENMKNRTQLGDSPGNPVHSIWNLANTVNVEDLKGDPDKWGAVPPGVTMPDLKQQGEEYQQSGNTMQQNPWWCSYQFENSNIRDRIIASGTMRYDIFDFLYLQGKAGTDSYNRNGNTLIPQGTGYQRAGAVSEYTQFISVTNLEWILGHDKEYGSIGVNSFFGGNKMVSAWEDIILIGDSFNIPFFTSINNTQSQSFRYGYTRSGTNSLFGSAEVSYNNYLYLTATARNDWFSVLNPEYNSAFYPSFGASFVFTEAFNIFNGTLDFGKIRAAWGQVATALVDPYFINNTYSPVGQGHIGRPLGAFTIGWNLPNPSLGPTLSTELEIGTDVRFFEGRLGLEFSYYDQKTTDDMAWVTTSYFSGYIGSMVNIGELSNKGYEIILNGSPVTGSFRWDISINLAKNNNKVLDLGGGLTEVGLRLPGSLTVQIKHIVGYPYGMITGYIQKTDSLGNKVYTSDGQPVRSAKMEIIGKGVADLTGGISSSMTYKGIRLDFLIDFKSGGDIYSGTNMILAQSGIHEQTVPDREGGMNVEGVTQTKPDTDGTPVYEPISMTLNQQQTYNYWHNLAQRDQAHFTYDASFVKLRQVVLEFNLSSGVLEKTPFKSLAFSILGSNLAILYRKTENIDPESDYSNTESQGLDYFGMPGTRSYGFKIKLGF